MHHNRCIIPKELPDAAYRMMGSWLDLDCNFTLPQPSLSLSLTHTLLDLPSTATPCESQAVCVDVRMYVSKLM